MSKNKIGEDSPIPKFIYLHIRRRDGVESLTTLEDGEFKVPIDSRKSKKLPNIPTYSFHQYRGLAASAMRKIKR